jgi:hypothetical protein
MSVAFGKLLLVTKTMDSGDGALFVAFVSSPSDFSYLLEFPHVVRMPLATDQAVRPVDPTTVLLRMENEFPKAVNYCRAGFQKYVHLHLDAWSSLLSSDNVTRLMN